MVAVDAMPPCEAVIEADVELDTGVVLIGKLAELDPARTVTLACTGAFVLFEARAIPTPPEPAGPDRVTVPIDFVPPTTELGAIDTPFKVGGLMVNCAVFVTPDKTPLILAEVVLCTPDVEILKFADVEPAATVTDAGTVAKVPLELRLILIPPSGAALLRVAEPIADAPPMTEVGDTVIPEREGAMTVIVADAATPPETALIIG
jgi:hypothetical protein